MSRDIGLVVTPASIRTFHDCSTDERDIAARGWVPTQRAVTSACRTWDWKLDEHDDLTTSLIELASLVGRSAPLEQTLSRLMAYPLHLVPSADGAVLTLLEDGQPRINIATDELTRSADQAHAWAGEGPSLVALLDGHSVASESLGRDLAFPRFGGRVARLGLHSAVAVPMTLDDGVIGVITLYSRTKRAFGSIELSTLEGYARPAAVVARNAQVLARSQVQIEQLEQALRIRPVIDQAIGIIRYRTGKSEEEAFGRLREMSNVKRMKVSDVARDLVDEAVRTARVRRHPAP
jgi:GAF domain-containing protein